MELVRGVKVNIENEQEKLSLENLINSKIINVVEDINFVLPGYQNGEKVRVMLRFSASINY